MVRARQRPPTLKRSQALACVRCPRRQRWLALRPEAEEYTCAERGRGAAVSTLLKYSYLHLFSTQSGRYTSRPRSDRPLRRPPPVMRATREGVGTAMRVCYALFGCDVSREPRGAASPRRRARTIVTARRMMMEDFRGCARVRSRDKFFFLKGECMPRGVMSQGVLL